MQTTNLTLIQRGAKLSDTIHKAVLPYDGGGDRGSQSVHRQRYEVMPFQNLLSDNEAVEYVVQFAIQKYENRGMQNRNFEYCVVWV
jgi:hypothetical protein